MKKTMSVLQVLFLVAGVFAAGVNGTEKKSITALKMDKYDEGQMGTLEIQLEVGKTVLMEYEKSPTITPSAEEKKKGYLVFLRNYLFEVKPYVGPSQAEIGKKDLKVFATPGEFEPIVFGVFPLEKLTNCKIDVSDFVSETGEKMAKDVFQINNVCYRPIAVSQNDPVDVRAEILIKAKEIPLIEAGISKMIWINVKVPETAKEGTYKGKVTFTPAGKTASEIPVEVKVLPFKLLQFPPEVMSYVPAMAGSWNFEVLEKEFTAIREHGMTGEVVGGELGPEGDFTKANKFMEVARKTGMPGKFYSWYGHIQGVSKFSEMAKFFTVENQNRMKDVMAKTRDNAKANNWLPWVQYLTTELGSSTSGGKDDFAKTMKASGEYYTALRAVEGVKLIATFNRQEQLTMHWNLPALDETGFNGEMFPEWEKAAKAKPSMMTFVAIDQRCGYGFYLWKFNLKSARPWCLHPYIMGPKEPGLLYYENKEERPSARFERIREGVDDFKYVYTLNEYVKQAKAKGKDTSVAEKTIQTVMGKIPHDHKKDAPGADYTKLDEYRWQLAEQIIKLSK